MPIIYRVSFHSVRIFDPEEFMTETSSKIDTIFRCIATEHTYTHYTYNIHTILYIVYNIYYNTLLSIKRNYR